MIPRKTLTVTRYGLGSDVKGHYVEGTPSTFNITASVQPLRPNEMLLLPEGRRESEAFRLYTDTQLLPARKDSTNAEKVAIGSVDYEVLSCAIWDNNIIPHFKAIVVRL